ncbi:MAG: zinc ribbon domain-containing protein [Promethearchaeota archaeon]
MPIFYSVYIYNFKISPNYQIRDNFIINSCADKSNFSISADLPKIIWFEAYLNIKISSELDGKIKCISVDSKGGKYFSIEETVINIKKSESKTIQMKLNPHLSTLPGKYQFGLVIWYIENENNSVQIYSKNFDTILIMGPLFLYCNLIIFSTAILIILTKNPSEEEIIAAQTGSQQGIIPEHKIKCPECGKIIDEGLTFCPECGNRIPEFLRFGPGSSSGI